MTQGRRDEKDWYAGGIEAGGVALLVIALLLSLAVLTGVRSGVSCVLSGTERMVTAYFGDMRLSPITLPGDRRLIHC